MHAGSSDVGLRQSLERLRPGDHACLIHRSRREQFAAVVPFVAIGLDRGERCLCITDTTASNSRPPARFMGRAVEMTGTRLPSGRT